ncbi:hypothetical protein RIF29_37498 [Crotalaria pallida]|uniref:Uncharacterized protein n=1 Tax=Crotalaria pallida TaxID=3830 RepID=A0AAN9EJ17_CROPI
MDRNIASSSSATILIITCLCLLFLLFITSAAFARYLFDSTTDDDHTNCDDSFSVSSDNNNNVPADATDYVNTNLFLPSEKSDYVNPSTLIQWQTSLPKPGTVESIEVAKVDEIDPFTLFNFHRSNDPRIRSLPLHFRHHRCRHNHRFKPRFSRSKDGTLNNKEDKEFHPAARGDGVSSEIIRADEWRRFRQIEPMLFSRERSMAVQRSELLRRLYNRRRHHHHHHHHHRNEPSSIGLMKRIRKFLNNF